MFLGIGKHALDDVVVAQSGGVHAPIQGPGGNCIKIGFPGKTILGYYFQENMTFPKTFLLLRISFPGSPIFIQFIPAAAAGDGDGANCRAVECSLSGRGCHCGGELRKKMAITKFNLIIKIDH